MQSADTPQYKHPYSPLPQNPDDPSAHQRFQEMASAYVSYRSPAIPSANTVIQVRDPEHVRHEGSLRHVWYGGDVARWWRRWPGLRRNGWYGSRRHLRGALRRKYGWLRFRPRPLARSETIEGPRLQHPIRGHARGFVQREDRENEYGKGGRLWDLQGVRTSFFVSLNPFITLCSLQLGCEGERETKTLREVRGQGLDHCHDSSKYYALMLACRDQSPQLGPSRLGTHRAMCSECEGHGEKLREKDRCAALAHSVSNGSYDSGRPFAGVRSARETRRSRTRPGRRSTSSGVWLTGNVLSSLGAAMRRYLAWTLSAMSFGLTVCSPAFHQAT